MFCSSLKITFHSEGNFKMSKSKNSRQHGVPPRGLLAMSNHALSMNHMTGRFGRMFPHLPPALFSEASLSALADAMVTTDLPKDGEESDFGAAYTYLGQFIDHDLTFDPSTFAQQQSDPSGISDFRTPAFDLDNVYGRGQDISEPPGTAGILSLHTSGDAG